MRTTANSDSTRSSGAAFLFGAHPSWPVSYHASVSGRPLHRAPHDDHQAIKTKDEVTAETAGLVRRVELLEEENAKLRGEPRKAEAVATVAKPARVDVLRARHNAKKAEKEVIAA